MIVGGFGGSDSLIGIANAAIFNPTNNSWTAVPNMAYRRWYPTATTLSDGRVLVVAPATDERLILSARNLPEVEVILADSLNVVDLLNADVVLIEQPALARMSEVYA